LTVVEIERPRRGERRRGKSDPIDAHLAALHALRPDADRLPAPRADGPPPRPRHRRDRPRTRR
jgi:transposase